MSNNSHAIRNGVITTVVGGAILAGILSSWFRGLLLGFGRAVAKPFVAIWHWLTVTTTVPNWLLSVLILLACATIIRWLIAILRATNVEKESYNHDTIFGVHWRWSGGAAHINNLWCFCPKCDAELVYHEQRQDYRDVSFLDSAHFTQFVCENCSLCSHELDGDQYAAVARVKREIRRRFRTSEWKKNTQP
ncbi:hypothetical protein P3T73_07350 [Kiritimatiellota bacterium B12222]|nr:hypothetical protein P3T73_07350 [Kiritimatiellota bacterium B12222]